MRKTSQKQARNLWAPWRMAYVRDNSRQQCVFCVTGRESKDAEKFVLYRNEIIFVMMNRFPYAYGHLLVSPVRHVKDLEDLSRQELQDLMVATRDAVRILQQCLTPEGFNIGINLGEVAGAGYADHLHIHIVPRWHGDYNFMPVVAETGVISEHLDDTYHKLRERFDILTSKSGDTKDLTSRE